MKTINRSLLVQAVTFMATKKTDEKWGPGLIHQDLWSLFEATSSIGERRFPPLGKAINDGQLVVFVNNYKKFKAGAVMFTVCAYRHGHVPESVKPDFSKNEVDIKAIEIVDEDGEPEELVYTYRCLAYGQILIAELVQGSGGVSGLQKLLGSLLRSHSGISTKYPHLRLKDIVAPSLKALIDSHGGVVSIRATALRAAEPAKGRFGKMLSKTASSVSGTNKCVVEWVSDKGDTIDTDTSLAIMDEYDDEYLSGVTLTLKKGGSIKDLKEYVEKRVAKIPLSLDRRPSVTAIEAEIKQYLADLCSGISDTIKTDGTLKNTKIVERD